MILSVSRRTDIPAFYFDWFLKRLNEGYLYVKNPMNPKQVSRIALDEENIDCIVFWTKDPGNALAKLEELGNHMYYFQYTLNPYDHFIERKVPPLKQRIKVFKELSQKIGKERVIWRYDPIFLTRELDINYHLRNFQYLCKELDNYTSTVMVSILVYYQKIRKNMEALSYREITGEELSLLIPSLREIAKNNNLEIKSCAEDWNLKYYGIEPGRCIDNQLISQLLGEEINIKKDKSQRKTCGCGESIEVGAYNTCLHGCRYCYANFSDSMAQKNYRNHDSKAPLLLGKIEEKDKIKDRKIKKFA